MTKVRIDMFFSITQDMRQKTFEEAKEYVDKLIRENPRRYLASAVRASQYRPREGDPVTGWDIKRIR